MPKVNIHLQQAKFNEEIAERAVKSKHHDWAVTMYFYAALHYVEAYARHNGDDIYELYKQHNTQHKRRLHYVMDIGYEKTGSFITDYEYLYNGSMKARYLKGIKTTSRKHFFNNLDQYSDALSRIKELFAIPTA